MAEDHRDLLYFSVFVVKRKRRFEYRAFIFRFVLEPSPRSGDLCRMEYLIGGLISFEFFDISSIVIDVE